LIIFKYLRDRKIIDIGEGIIRTYFLVDYLLKIINKKHTKKVVMPEIKIRKRKKRKDEK